ncbi:general transcription factor IIE polypeptide 1 GTF2E1 [Babesia caballi]|uniref:General transcription factor IIE polypeptide 1 GTF2E1 n=1 Tax=Babesia caballi TaxID=5871 RepID=A0AAV4LZM9_BABCB|nr:general transcription factor IIE polypeptide 1 GTF2E1 [Babesia caballi]
MALDSAQKGGIGAIGANTTRKAYDKETFAALVESCSRLFCCDEEIVITDLLLAVEKAVSERDMEAEIGLPERKIHEFLVRLERHGLVNRVTVGQASDITAKQQRQPKVARDVMPAQQQPNTQSFWRLSSYFIVVVHYKISKMEEVLQQRRRSLHEVDRFVCPACNAVYDSLEVQKLEMDGFDAHFICYCGSKVELDDKAAKDSIYSSQQQRCEEQVRNLKKCLAAAWGMEVPQFPVYVKGKDKPGQKEAEKADGQTLVNATESAVGGASSVVSAASGTSESSAANTPRPVVKSLLSEVNKQTRTHLNSRGESGKIKFRMHGLLGQKAPSVPVVTAAVKLMTAPSQEKALEETPAAVPPEPPVLEPVKEPEADAHAKPEEEISFYITKLGRSFPLAEAQDQQQHMNNEEFERFLELQDTYLNFL